MMKAVYSAGILLLFIVVVVYGRDCETSSDCNDDECCLSNIQPRGRRALSRGTCQKRGTDGSRCVKNELSTGHAGLYYDCPCASGYFCNGTGLMVINKGEAGICESIVKTASSTLGQPCSTGSDCADNECCVNDIRPIGKRGRRQFLGGAHCKLMGQDGQGCLVSMGSGKPDHSVYSCPCVSGLTCHGNGFYDIPLGETGVCGA